jgi:hypothetical protein
MERAALGLSPGLRTPPTRSRRRTPRWGQAIEARTWNYSLNIYIWLILQSVVHSQRATSRRTAICRTLDSPDLAARRCRSGTGPGLPDRARRTPAPPGDAELIACELATPPRRRVSHSRDPLLWWDGQPRRRRLPCSAQKEASGAAPCYPGTPIEIKAQAGGAAITRTETRSVPTPTGARIWANPQASSSPPREGSARIASSPLR